MVAIDDSREERLALLAHQIDLLSLEFAQEAAACAAWDGRDHEVFATAIDSLVHRDGWQVIRQDDGRLMTVPPVTRFPRGPD